MALLFFKTDTTGEKDFEEFYTEKEDLLMDRFSSIGIIQNEASFIETNLDIFEKDINHLRKKGKWCKEDILKIFNEILPEFDHKETGKYLDQRM